MNSALHTFTLAALILAPAACGGTGSTTTNGAGGSSSHSSAQSSGATSTSATTGTGMGGATSSTGTGMGGSGPTPEKACADQAAAVCALRNTCSPGYDVKRNYGTDAVCQSRTTQTCVNALDAKGTGSSPAHVDACATAYPGEMCSDFYDNNPVAACVPPAGTLAMGAACGNSAQCASTYCAVAQYTICGTCQPLPVAGATCQVQADCGRDLACAIPALATSGKCAAFVASGGACLTGVSPCQSGFACVGDVVATMTMGICTAQPAMGAACDGSRKTAPNCEGNDGLVCIPAANGSSVGTCQAIKLVGAAGVCGDVGMAPITGFNACANGGLCKKAVPTDLSGTCVAAAADNAACDNDAAIGPPCLSPARCVVPAGSPGTAGKCTVPNATTCM